jgi:hypothetical protein
VLLTFATYVEKLYALKINKLKLGYTMPLHTVNPPMMALNWVRTVLCS